MIAAFLIGLFLILITLTICSVLRIATICDEEEIKYERRNKKRKNKKSI